MVAFSWSPRGLLVDCNVQINQTTKNEAKSIKHPRVVRKENSGCRDRA